MRRSRPKSGPRQLKNRSRAKLSAAKSAELKQYKSLGIIDVSGDESRSTIYKKITKARRKYFEELQPAKFFFIRTPKGKAGPKIKDRAERIGLNTTEKGFFYPKEPGVKDLKLRVDTRGRGRLVAQKRVKGTSGRIRTETIVTPIEDPDQYLRTEEKLLRDAEKLGPLKKGEKYTFRVKEKGRDGISTNYFSKSELLIRYIEHYEKAASLNTPLKKLNWKNYFFRRVEIVKTSERDWRSEIKKLRRKQTDARKKRHGQGRKPKR